LLLEPRRPIRWSRIDDDLLRAKPARAIQRY
jgi:hypothetical protein